MPMFPSFNARAVGLPELPAETTIRIAAEAGFEGVDLLVRDLVRQGNEVATLRKRMDDLGLRGGAFPLPLDWKRDEVSFRAELAELPRFAEAAARLGLTRTGTWVLPETPLRPEDPAEKAAHFAEITAWHVDRLGSIAEVFSRFSIRLGLEVIGVASFRTGDGWPFVTRMAELEAPLGALFHSHPSVGVLADVFHLHAADEPVDAALAWGIDRVIWAHVADLPATSNGNRASIVDADRGLPGESGWVGVAGFLKRLQEAGYDGPVTAEPLARCRSLQGLEPGEVARRLRESLASVWPNP